MRLLIFVAPAMVLGAWAQQASFQYPRMGGQWYAGSFAHWTARVSTPVLAAGTPVVFVSPARVTLAGADSITPIAVGVPVQVNDGVQSEIIIPTSVDCSSQTCNATATFANVHLGGFTLSSASYGLNEAIRAAAVTGGTVIVGPDWGGSSAQIDQAAGAANVTVADDRAGKQQLLVWNGDGYVASGGITAAGGLTAASPAITPTSIEQVRYADLFAGQDWCAQLQAADASLGTQPGLIVYPSFTGTKSCATQLVLTNPNHSVWLQAGTYELNAEGAGKAALLIAASGVSIYGDGIGRTVLQMGPHSEDDVVRGCTAGPYPGGCRPLYDVSIHDLTVNGEQTNTTGYGNDTYQNGININSCTRCRVYDVRVTNVWAQGIIVGSAQSATYFAGTYTLSGTTLTADSGPAFDTSGQWNGISMLLDGNMAQIATVTDATHLTLVAPTGIDNSGAYFILTNVFTSIDHDFIDHFGEIGIGLEANQNYNSIANDRIGDVQHNPEFSTQVGIDVSGSASQEYYTRVSRNTISDLGANGTGIYAVDNLHGLNIGDNDIIGANRCIVVGYVTATAPNSAVSAHDNTCADVDGIGLADTEVLPATGLVWTRNMVFNAAGSGFAFANVVDGVITDNLSNSVGTEGSDSYVFNNVVNSTIADNQDVAPHGVSYYIVGASTGNRLVDNVGAAQDSGTSPSAIINSGTIASSWDSTVPLSVTSNTASQMQITSGNGYSGCMLVTQVGITQWSMCNTASSGLLTLAVGADTWLSLNPSNGAAVLAGSLSVGGGMPVNAIYRTSATLTYTTIAAQSCQDQTVAVSGAAGTATASASPGAPLGGITLSWSAWVSSANVVSVRVCNPSLSSITPNVVTWNVEVVQ